MKYHLKVFTACVIAAMLVTVAHAAEKPDASSQPKPRFTVVQGKGWSVCESYARFLSAQPESEPLPLCHLKLSPELKEPNWEDLDVQTHLEMIYSIEYPPYLNSLHPDKPPPAFDRWKADFERQIQAGRSPRLRHAHLALLSGGPVETILAYDADAPLDCDDMVKKVGFSFNGEGSHLALWNEKEQKIDDYRSYLTFSLPGKLVLFQGKPFLFLTFWGGNGRYSPSHPHELGQGTIYVNHFVSSGNISGSYGNIERCVIRFDLTSQVTQKMSSPETAEYFKRMIKNELEQSAHP